jgi:hypothetical protein
MNRKVLIISSILIFMFESGCVQKSQSDYALDYYHFLDTTFNDANDIFYINNVQLKNDKIDVFITPLNEDKHGYIDSILPCYFMRAVYNKSFEILVGIPKVKFVDYHVFNNKNIQEISDSVVSVSYRISKAQKKNTGSVKFLNFFICSVSKLDKDRLDLADLYSYQLILGNTKAYNSKLENSTGFWNVFENYYLDNKSKESVDAIKLYLRAIQYPDFDAKDDFFIECLKCAGLDSLVSVPKEDIKDE